MTFGTFREDFVHETPMQKVVALSQNNNYEMWFSQREKERWMKESASMLSEAKRKEALERIEKLQKDFSKFLKLLRNMDYSKISNKELCEFLDKYLEFHTATLNCFCYSNPQSTNAIEYRIKEILRAKLNPKQAERYFIDLSTPEEFDETMLERLHWNALLKQAVTNKLLLNHALHFPALFFNVYNEDEVLTYLKNRVKESSYEREESLQIFVDKIRERHAQIFKEFQNQELETISKYLQAMGLWRYRLKHLWSGSEFVALPFFKKICKRTGISLKDLFSVYLPEDVKRALKKGELLNEKEKRERLKCTVFKGAEGKLSVYFGEAAEKIVNNRGLTETNAVASTLSGQVANSGFVKGKARVVFVTDLTGFERDLENFKNGEILVTTMTSPLMVPIVRKASGIVTDEGGICSHAAVVAREFNIPCIVGTHFATKVLKDGDLVEVDANKGVVKKIN